MPHTPYTPINTDRILTTNADLDRRWRTLKAELDAQHARTARMILDTRKIVDDTKRVLEGSIQCLHSGEEDTPHKPL
jgi:hypothetical protein